jgi:hypothetical protein
MLLDDLGDVCIHVKTVLKWMLKKSVGVGWTELMVAKGRGKWQFPVHALMNLQFLYKYGCPNLNSLSFPLV